MKFLIVDDSATMRMLLTITVRKAFPGSEYKEAENGLEGLKALTDDDFDIVLSDIQMPHMDGLTFVRSIREKHGAALPVIMITTKGAEKDIENGLAAGATDYITKPIDYRVFKETILKHIKD